MTVTYHLGDTRAVVATIPDGTVDLILTSPPFLALRSYLPADHPDKALEIGSEPDPATFIDMLLELTADWRRVLAPHGSIAVELGDTYSGSGGAGGDYAEGGWRDGQGKTDGSARRMRPVKASPDTGVGDACTTPRDMGDGEVAVSGGPGWPLAKCKAMIPELYRIALAYGINPLTGQPSPAGRWRVRNVVTWCRPNPPVGALGDKYRPATSDMVIATVSSKRWFDLDAVRKPHGDHAMKYPRPMHAADKDIANPARNQDGAFTNGGNPAGAPPLDYWVIPPTGYSGSHYAVYPPELCRIPIESMCPREVCTQCGEPRRRIVGDAEYVPSATNRGGSMLADSERLAERVNQWVGDAGARASVVRSAPTLGWTDCGHDDYRPGHVLDPFGGSGTTGVAAQGAGRDCTLIDLDERNVHLARERIGLFMEEAS